MQKVLQGLHRERDAGAALQLLGGGRLVTVGANDFAALRGIELPARVKTLEFHVIPRLAPDATRQHMLPLSAVLTQHLNLEVNLKTYNDLEGFERSIYRIRKPALVNANPLHAQRLRKLGFEVIAQQLPVASPEGMRGLILVRTDSPYQALQDLEGRRIAFGGGPSAFFATIVPRALLKRAGLEGRYTDVSQPGPVTSVLPRLAEGDIDAIGLGSMGLQDKTLNARYIAGRMRVLAESDPIPGLAWLVGPRLDPDLRNQIRQLLLGFDAHAPGHAAMQAAGIERLLPADASTYAPIARYLEELNIR
jgi:ABC-type phosphate/phosphonate transport system substrate-binding protein